MTNQWASQAHFDQRAEEYQVPAPLLQNLKRHGVNTLGQLAFAIQRPGSDFDEATFDTWVRTINGGAAPILAAMTGLRQLHFESEVILTSTLKSQVEAPEPTGPKPFPFAERAARMNIVRNRLTGLHIHGQGEPSQSLVDECCFQYEMRTLRYIEAAKCTSRENEVQSGKTDKKLRLDANTLSLKESKQIPDESVSATHHLASCLRRRGIAYDFANLINFQSHDRYVEKLLRHLSIEPPPGFQATALSQVLRADREVFAYLSQNADDIRPQGAVKPLDNALIAALQDYNTPGQLHHPCSGGTTFAPL